MSDETPRDSEGPTPGVPPEEAIPPPPEEPPAPEPTQTPGTAEVGQTEPPVETAEAIPPAGEPPRSDRLSLRLKALIPILIGFISVSGAVATWQVSRLGSAASDADDQAISESITAAKDDARAELQLRSEQSAYARYRGDVAAADSLRELATKARDELGNEQAATAYEDEAQVLDAIADKLSELSFNVGYVQGEEGQETYDEETRRRDLVAVEQGSRNALAVNPRQTAAVADKLRNRSQRLVGWIVVFTFAILFLALAQMSASRRVLLAGAGLGIYVIAVIGAILGEVLKWG